MKPSLPLSAMLQQIAQDETRDRVRIRDLLDLLGDRALAALLFVFAFPNVLPTPPGTSSVLGAPLIFLAAQLCLGIRPWLPALIAERSLSRADFAALVGRVAPWLARAERLLRPRMSPLARPPMEYLLGFICLLLAVVLILPIPLGNMLPALAISLIALGILERDGLWILAGLLATVFALALVSGVLLAMVKAAIYLAARLF